MVRVIACLGLDRLRGRPRGDHSTAGASERHFQERTHALFVLREEDGAGPRAGRELRRSVNPPRPWGSAGIDAERRALLDHGLDLDGAAALMDDAGRPGQAESRALPAACREDGSKMCSRVSASIPLPSSVTDSTT